MSASEFLRNEHQDILRLEKVITKSYKALYGGVDIPFSDIDKINFLIAELGFLGLDVKTLTQTPFRWGLNFKAGL